MRRELLLGCGFARDKRIIPEGCPPAWEGLVTCDRHSACDPDVVWDLDVMPYPWNASEFDEIHAYEVLEHLGAQGDWRAFVAQFSEFHRILKRGGLLCATVPHWRSPWAWGDPGHRRVITPGTLAFLSQEQYERQVGDTSMSDYRSHYQAEFRTLWMQEGEHTFAFVLRAE